MVNLGESRYVKNPLRLQLAEEPEDLHDPQGATRPAGLALVPACGFWMLFMNFEQLAAE